MTTMAASEHNVPTGARSQATFDGSVECPSFSANRLRASVKLCPPPPFQSTSWTLAGWCSIPRNAYCNGALFRGSHSATRSIYADVRNFDDVIAYDSQADMCTECYHKIFSHKAEAVEGDEAVRRALEYTAEGEKTPSQVLKKGDICDGSGALFLGGFKAVLNNNFIATAGVGAVVNTAKGLEMFGPKYVGGVAETKARGVDFLDLNWVDAHDQILPVADLQRSVKYIHAAIITGKSVVVHCAQGKSRSTTVVLAYLSSAMKERLTMVDALAFVKERRAMAG